jgi:hypothetical protein
MDRELLHQLVTERVVRRREDAAAERLSRRAGVVEDPLLDPGAPIRGVRRTIGFLLARLGLRTALGGARC